MLQKHYLFANFTGELRNLCEKHKVTIRPSTYINLEVWNRYGEEDVLDFDFVENKMKENDIE